MLSVCLAPGAMAASSSGTSVYLYDNGADAPNAETDWYAKVDQPLFVLRDGSTDLVLDVAMVMHNGSGSATDGTYTIAVTISDGATEVAQSVTIVTATATAGQITFTAASLDALADTTAGTVTYTLSQNDIELDSYVWSQVTIDGNQATGSMLGIIPLMVGLFVLIAVFSMIGGVFGKLGKQFKR